MNIKVVSFSGGFESFVLEGIPERPQVGEIIQCFAVDRTSAYLVRQVVIPWAADDVATHDVRVRDLDAWNVDLVVIADPAKPLDLS